MIHRNKAEKWGLEEINNEPAPKSHEEKIRCPSCGFIQTARVVETWPWYSYAHGCDQCGFIITESDWEVCDDLRSGLRGILKQDTMSGIAEFYGKIESIMETILRIKLEERGYEFPDKSSLLRFVENEMRATTQFSGGSPFNKIVMFSIKGEDSPLVGIGFSFVEKELGFTVTIKARDTTTPD